MRDRASASDRIVLFTLVDLLLQIIFCGFLLFAANRASQGDVQDQIALLARTFGVVSVSRFLEATSKLVAIADLGKVDVVPTTDKSRVLFADATKMLEGLTQDDVGSLAKMDAQQRRAFMKMYAAMPPADRLQLSTFVNRYGSGVMKALLNGGLSAKQLRVLLDTLARLPAADQDRFRYLAVTFANADPAKRQKIVAATAILVRPMCFNRQQAFRITEVPSGYLVLPLIGAVAPDVRRLLASEPRLGPSYRLSGPAFRQFGAAITAAHSTCMIRVDQATTTNDERQLIAIQRWFATY